jgi:hypothetical protein
MEHVDRIEGIWFLLLEVRLGDFRGLGASSTIDFLLLFGDTLLLFKQDFNF